MANISQDHTSHQSSASTSKEPKTYTTTHRTWPQLHIGHTSESNTSSYTNAHPQAHHQTQASNPASQPSSTSSNHYNHTSTSTNTHSNPNLHNPLSRWLNESQQQSPYDTIYQVEYAPAGHYQAVQGGEKMERGNGGNERSAEENWSMEGDVDGQSEKWV
ncbi:hypothetical protein ONS95_002887 [Cadophora gregata]|uniref:uncharacterized protein n=1 Tax=Cadophora gregata TaxID=51156 RepID=UPI0026DBD155|nr:uncharacterized protein ONS95_002887 [Cadophora gregata]KAK0108067.1 hypothetical protein ONS95_002887 [Cadophora gregata]KAK0109346.1 hypothetical protein ONS96_003165 [Cadophora gregata f. sp. sojae]